LAFACGAAEAAPAEATRIAAARADGSRREVRRRVFIEEMLLAGKRVRLPTES